MDHSPFAKLPGELRNQIYEYVLSSSMRIEFDGDGIPDHDPKYFLALTATCKQICMETAAFAGDANEFFLLPHRGTSELSNDIINRPFDLMKWFNSVSTLPRCSRR